MKSTVSAALVVCLAWLASCQMGQQLPADCPVRGLTLPPSAQITNPPFDSPGLQRNDMIYRDDTATHRVWMVSFNCPDTRFGKIYEHVAGRLTNTGFRELEEGMRDSAPLGFVDLRAAQTRAFRSSDGDTYVSLLSGLYFGRQMENEDSGRLAVVVFTYK